MTHSEIGGLSYRGKVGALVQKHAARFGGGASRHQRFDDNRMMRRRRGDDANGVVAMRQHVDISTKSVDAQLQAGASNTIDWTGNYDDRCAVA